MNINVQFVDTRKIASVEELVNEKLTQLEAKYDFITNAAVFLKEEKHEGDRSHVCEVRLSVPLPWATCLMTLALCVNSSSWARSKAKVGSAERFT